ncbi:MAG TPA: hypothetical protein PK765_00495, partial [bacterium]|nr:hypothetical protein [bacterium]
TGGGATGGGATGGGATGGGATGGATPAKPSIKCTGELPLTALFESEDDSPYSILYVYAYGIFKVEDLTKISAENSISSLGDLVFGLFSGITMFFIMLLLCIGIVFVLFTRVIQLWIFAILSPLFGLFFFLGENVMGSGDDGFGKYNLKKFIGLAMVPVYISAALSFGMMLCVVVATTDTTKTSSDGTTSYVQLKTEGDKEIITIGRNPETQLKLTVVGMPLGLAKNLAEVKKVGFGALGKILVMIIALVILWMAVVAGAKSSTITAEAISPIENFGKSVG